MTLQQLRYIIEIAQSGSISLAAQRLFITQPSLSKSVADLEKEMAKQRVVFVQGAEKNSISADKANEIFDLMEKFAAYGFNKSHSAAYAVISYHTAYLKVHYPAEFMAALLTRIASAFPGSLTGTYCSVIPSIPASEIWFKQ